MALTQKLYSSCSNIVDVYSDLLLENNDEIRIILLKIMAIVSPSTVAWKHGFSTMNCKKTSLRTSLGDAHPKHILRIYINGISLETFDSELHLDQWLTWAK